MLYVNIYEQIDNCTFVDMLIHLTNEQMISIQYVREVEGLFPSFVRGRSTTIADVNEMCTGEFRWGDV